MSSQSIPRALAGALLAALLAAGAPAWGTPPLRFVYEVDQTFYAPGLSGACGFDVYVTTQGTAHALLFVDADGTAIVREIDWNSGWTLTFTAPDNGTSYTEVEAGPLITSYPDGTEIGDPAIVMLVGSGGRIGDDPAEAGRILANAVVVFVDPATGIPGVDVVDVLAQNGSFIGSIVARRCAALAPE